MKKFLKNLKKIDIKESKATLFFEGGNIEIESYKGGIFHVSYSVDEIVIGKQLKDGSDYLSPKMDLIPSLISMEKKENKIELSCEGKSIFVDPEFGNLTFKLGDSVLNGGNLGNSDTVIPSQQFRCISREGETPSGRFNFPLYSEDEFYGLGDKGGSCNRKGRIFRFFNRDSLGYDAETNDPLYKSIPFFIKRRKGLYCGIFFDSPLVDYMDFGKESSYYYSIKVDGGPFSYFCYLSDSYSEVLKGYYQTTGFPSFPPLFSFGYLGSSMNYVESDDAKDRILNYFSTIEKYGIPCEGMYVSSGYLKAADGKRYAFLWNKEKFPNYKEYLKDLSSRGYNLIMNIKPGILTTHPWYDSLAQKGYFIKDNTGQPYKEFFWGGDASLIDFSNKEAREWWKKELKSQYLEHGCSGIWNDNNEFEIEDIGIEASSIKSILPMLMSQASYEAFMEMDDSKRPWIYSRSGYAGIQRYARTWTGDNRSDWKTLKFNQYMGMSLGLSGIPYYGHDIGGFFGEIAEEELLVRSCQSAVFQPRFVIHSWREDDKPTEPWTYKNSLPGIINLIKEHYKFMPYIYNAAYKTLKTGAPMDRNLHLEFKDPHVSKDESDTLFGDDILKVLFVEKGIDKRFVYLPSDCNWYDWLGKFHKGGNSVNVKCPLGEHRYFVREGSLIAKTNEVEKLSSSLFKDLIFTVYPIMKGKRKGEYFEDDGNTFLNRDSYNIYEWEISETKLSFTKRKSGIEKNGRLFTFQSPDGNELFRIDPDNIKQGETLTIEL